MSVLSRYIRNIVMSVPALNQRHLQTLGHLLTAAGHSDVFIMLQSSLERLVAFWPAEGGALLYQAPHSEIIRLEYGGISAEASRMIVRRVRLLSAVTGSERAIGSYAIDDDWQLLELPLQSEQQTVGLLHLVVRGKLTRASHAILPPNEEVVMLLVRAIGGEADKLSVLQHARHDLRELHLLYEVAGFIEQS